MPSSAEFVITGVLLLFTVDSDGALKRLMCVHCVPPHPHPSLTQPLLGVRTVLIMLTSMPFVAEIDSCMPIFAAEQLLLCTVCMLSPSLRGPNQICSTYVHC